MPLITTGTTINAASCANATSGNEARPSLAANRIVRILKIKQGDCGTKRNGMKCSRSEECENEAGGGLRKSLWLLYNTVVVVRLVSYCEAGGAILL
jgi:hypothetical protein